MGTNIEWIAPIRNGLWLVKVRQPQFLFKFPTSDLRFEQPSGREAR